MLTRVHTQVNTGVGQCVCFCTRGHTHTQPAFLANSIGCLVCVCEQVAMVMGSWPQG